MPSQQQEPPPPVVIDGEGEYHMEEISDSKIVRRRLKNLVKWTGYDHPDWEPTENVNGLAAVDEFHERYPGKPGPLPEDDNEVSLELVPKEGSNVTAIASDRSCCELLNLRRDKADLLSSDADIRV